MNSDIVDVQLAPPSVFPRGAAASVSVSTSVWADGVTKCSSVSYSAV